MSDPKSGLIGQECLDRFPKCRILVVGDIMLDEYVWGSVRRISPEAPVPVVAVTGDSRVLGGAANVAVNVSGLGAVAHLAGLIGGDGAGRDILRMLKKGRIGVTGVVVEEDRPTTRKTRVIAHSQQVVRVDREKKEMPGAKASSALIKRTLALVKDVDGVVLSDYRKGVLSHELVSAVVSEARARGVFVAVDPKQTDFGYYAGCTVITPNKGETEAALGGREITGDLEIAKAGRDLLRKCRADAILITRGEEGMTLVERGKSTVFNVPAQARQVFDVTGAGDTVIGTLSVAMGAGATMREAALLANVAAGVVVGEVGTSPINIEKLMHALKVQDREREASAENARERLAGAKGLPRHHG